MKTTFKWVEKFSYEAILVVVYKTNHLFTALMSTRSNAAKPLHSNLLCPMIGRQTLKQPLEKPSSDLAMEPSFW